LKEKNYLGKTAISKDNRELGSIVRVDGSPTSVIISQKPHVIIEVKRFIFSPDFIQLPLDLVLEIKEATVRFDILKRDFATKQKTYRAHRKNQIKTNEKGKNKDKDYDKDIDNTVAAQRPWI
jgi:hypothetical protein